MKVSSFLAVITLIIFAQSCSVSSVNSDLKEYGYKGEVKSLKSITYTDLEQESGKWILDDSKISVIAELIFNEEGNIVRVKQTVDPSKKNESETTVFEFKDNRKSSYYKLNAAKDTIEQGVYTWMNDQEYKLTISLPTLQTIKTTSKLNENFRDLSGRNQYIEGDSVIHSRSYVNTIDEEGLISKINYTDDITSTKSSVWITYGNFDPQGNPQKIIVIDGASGDLQNLLTREFTYFN